MDKKDVLVGEILHIKDVRGASETSFILSPKYCKLNLPEDYLQVEGSPGI